MKFGFMNGKANNFPVNIWGLVLGVLATTAIALSGNFTGPFWDLPTNLNEFLKWFGWLLAAGLFLWLFYQAKKGFEIKTKTIILVSIILSVPFLITYSVLAGDLFAYIANIKVAALGNPYVLTPGYLGNDLILKLVDPAWHNWPSTFGPLWNIFSKLVSYITQKPDVLMLIIKILCLMAVCFCVKILSKKTQPALVALFAWSPIVLVEAVGDAHNDIFIALGLVLALYWLKKPIKSSLALGASIAIKYIPILALPAILFNYQKSRKDIWKYIFFSLAIVIITIAPFWAGINTFRGLGLQNGLFFPPVFFPQSILYYGSYGLAGPNFNPEIFSRAIGLIIFFGFWVYLLYKVNQKKLEIPEAVFLTLAAYLFFATTYVQTWYLLWLLPLVFFFKKPKILKYTAILSIIWVTMLLTANYA
ncbi:MAG: hypothetical protein WCT08_05140 [Patescibacteria group bacterium]